MSSDTAIETVHQKIDELNYEAWNIRVQDSPKAFSLSQEALELARRIQYIRGIAEGARSLGFCYGRLSKYDEAMPLLKEALSLFEKLNDLDGQSNVIEYMGFIHRNQGDLGTSLKLLFRALSLSEQTGFGENLATNHYQLGVTYKHLGDYEKALNHLYKSISINREMNNRLYEAYSINVIGSIYLDNDDYEHALEYYQQGLIARHEAGDKWGEAGSLDNIGFTYLKLKDYDQAIKYCNQSLAISRSTDDKRGQANVLLHLAEIYKQTNDKKQATKLSNESLEIRKASGDKRGEAEILLFLAELNKSQKENEKQVLEWLTNAVRIAEELKAVDLLSKARYHLYDYYKEIGDYAKALENLNLHTNLEKEFHKNAINQKVKNLEISHDAEEAKKEAEAERLRNKELTELNEQIEKANAELKIESALERVRSAAMAMKEPADMLEVCKIISNQLAHLDVKEIRNVQTAIFYETKGSYTNYEYYAKHDKLVTTEVDYNNHSVAKDFAGRMLGGPNKVWTHEFKDDEVREWLDYQKSTNVFIDSFLETAQSLNYYWYSLGPVALGMSTYVPLKNEEIELFKRFRNVFELAYRRFLDIEKARGQAREAQIQLALERVRARTMAMHHSDEITDTVKLIYQEFDKLNLSNESTDIEIGIIDEQTGIADVWAHFYLSDGTISKFKFPVNLFPLVKDEFTIWKSTPAEKRNELFFTTEFSGKVWDEMIEVISTLPELNEIFSPLQEAKITKWVTHNAYFSHGMLTLQGIEQYSPETLEIQKRFARVFEQTYTRFLDLKKAEAQAREAKIEAALERVRSRTMAMHKSDDVLHVIAVVGEQLHGLGIPYTSTTIVTDVIPEKGFTLWLKTHGLKEPIKFFVPLFDLNFLHRLAGAMDNGEEFLTYTMNEQETRAWYHHMFTNTILKSSPEELKQLRLQAKSYHISVAFLKNKVELTIGIVDGAPYTDEENIIIKRFGKVFEQAYTRYLDLQKAEAQAKEAQIEVALERIRARAMAMHSSNELIDVANILREQMGLLGQPELETSVVSLYDKQSGVISNWNAFRQPGTTSGSITTSTSSFSKDSSELTKEMAMMYEAGKTEFTLTASGSKLSEFFQVLIKSDPLVASYAGRYIPEQAFYHFTAFTGGALLTVSYQPPSEETKIMQRRAASVFDMAYRRYLDLKKAEAQTREAQIEVAVERVRAKALAMHKSEEILSVVVVLRNELLSLNIPGVSGTTIYLKQDDGRIRMWDLTSVIELEDGFHMSMDIVFPLEETHPQLFIRQIWNAAEKYSVQVQNRDDLMRTVEWLAGYKKEEAENVKQFIETNDLRHLYHATVPLANGKLSVDLLDPPPGEMEPILQKMAAAFDLAYKRFVDLQKAEAQAREAQIETGLERVRSKTMAMHKSEEVTGIAVSLNEELVKLGFNGGSTIIIIDKKTGDTEQWTGFSADKTLRSCYVPYFKHPFHLAQLEAWQRGEKFLVYTVAGDEKKTLDQYYFTTGYKDFPESDKKWMRAMESVTFSHAFMKYGAIHWGPGDLTEEQLAILHRFAKVFEQSYTRFLDLQKAEAQAREAQIEAAVEKVRSRSLAMHKSDELQEVVHTVFERLKELNVEFYTAIIVVFSNDTKDVVWWLESKANEQHAKVLIPYQPISFFKDQFEKRKAGEDMVSKCYSFEEKNELFHHLFENTDLRHVPETQKQFLLGTEFATIAIALAKNTGIHITSYSRRSFSDQDHQIFKRFASVFDQAYTRFLDLQKAEAQAREAQIEASLERIRSKATAIRTSNELLDIIQTVFAEWKRLGLDLYQCNINLLNHQAHEWTNWGTGVGGTALPKSYKLPWFDHPFLNQLEEDVMTGVPYRAFLLEGDEYKRFVQHLFTNTDFKNSPKDYQDALWSIDKIYTTHAYMRYGSMDVIGPGSLPNNTAEILKRFAKVFEQAYTRYLDVVQAEAQARESQIQLAMERVRARTMAMQRSEELAEVATVLFQQVKALGVSQWVCGFSIWEIGDKEFTWYPGSPDGEILTPCKVPLTEHPVFISFDESRRRGDELFVYEKEGDFQADHYRYMMTVPGMRRLLQNMLDAGLSFPSFQIDHIANFSHGSLVFITYEPVPEMHDIFKRFAKVFEQTYTRFLDLQKAEAQAREAQIEAALEKVRAKVMAMQTSNDLNETSFVFGDQLKKLGIDWQFAYFWLIEEGNDDNTFWITWPDHKTSTTTYSWAEADTSFRECLIAWQQQVRIHTTHVPVQDVPAWLKTFERITNDAGGMAMKIMTPANFKEGVYYFDAMIRYGSFGILTNRETNAEEQNIQCRFATEFERAYTRFLDLQKAEAQAREAKIETALEKVRSRTMAMQKSGELGDVATVLFKELNQLVANLWTCGFVLCEKGREEDQWWLSTESGFIPAFYLPNVGDVTHYNIYQGWLKGEEYHTEQLEGEALLEHYDWLMTIPVAKKIFDDFAAAGFERPKWQKLHCAYFSKGYLCIITRVPCAEEQIFKRFAQVFDLTYTRFLDLQKAEAQTREALIEGALERVRARALAMQQPEELKDVAQVMRNEMGILGVEELETSSIYIHGDSSEDVECWYALQDPKHTEKKMVSDHFLLNLSDTWVGGEMKRFYSSDEKQTSIVMSGANRREWIEYCYKQSPAFSGFYGETIPDRTYHLYKFSHGYIGAAAPGDISAESWKLLSRAASVFSLAYSRFKDLTQARNDLVKLKEEKKRAEDALTELQNTQKQLIQSEKMASLGELTAGIAHEIQNPLNFVNNFSDVSNELLEEMKSELATGNTQSAIDIVNDVKDNLDKILHHGKRADAIVKSMLQHSRSSSGKKEPTDINALTDEYLRLAFHGLRAKDKSFNAKFETRFDNSIGKINIIPQEVGRVILNLINNAFYAVSEKQKIVSTGSTSNGYEPTVIVTTSKNPPLGGRGAGIEIKIKDNGVGMQQKVLDKIFQPFFTTKPTGQGTGLGLSLSYDIITKGHGGDIKVETKEGVGSTFIISLPMNN